MKKIILAILLILLASQVFAEEIEFAPNTVREMVLNVKMTANGNFSGDISSRDSMELKMLTFNDSETQDVLQIDEKLYIGDQVIEAKHETEGPNKFAVFELNPLKSYEDFGKFKIEINAKIKTKAIFELFRDYDLSTGISGFDEYLESTKYIESDDQELRSKAELEFNQSSQLETIKEIAEWVNTNIRYDLENYYNGTWSAKHTYNVKAGVCDEFANLTAAFMRIKGIPTKYITGVSYDGKQFGNHGWNQIYLGGQGWIGVDSTYGEAGYLDAAHLVLGQTTDASELTNLSVLTKSVKPLTIETDLSDPEIEIESMSKFEDLVDVKFEFPEKIYSLQEFELKVKLKNKNDSYIILPIKLVLHDDFVVEGTDQLVLFKPGEERELSWQVVSPELTQKDVFMKYEIIMIAPDQEAKELISLYPGKESTEEKSNIKIKDISPFIDEENFRVEILAFNKGQKEGNAVVKISYEGQENSYEETVPAFTEKKLVYDLTGIKKGTVLLDIASDENKSVKIVVPEKIKKKEEIKLGTTEVEKKPSTGFKEKGVVEFKFDLIEMLTKGIQQLIEIVMNLVKDFS